MNVTYCKMQKKILIDCIYLPESKLFAQFVVVARRNLKYASKRIRMSTVGELRSEDLDARMKHSQSKIRRIFIDPILM